MAEKKNQNTSRKNETYVMPESSSRVKHAHLGPVIGILIVFLALIFGGLYLWGVKLKEEQQDIPTQRVENNEPETPRAKANAEILQTTSSSDEIDAIEADLESTDLGAITAEIEKVARELDAALSHTRSNASDSNAPDEE